jgi:drug/metabolite transporter (DMT)-like permease
MLAIVYAALGSMFFGAMAVTLRLAFRGGARFEAVALMTMSTAFVVSAAIGAALYGGGGLTLHSLWPFAVAGLVAPGVSQLTLTRAVELIGASQTAILVGIAPMLSAIIAVVLLGEPLRVGLALGTVTIVAGGLLLAWKGGWSRRAHTLGFMFGALAAVAIASRDNFVRWAATANGLPGATAAAVSLGAATVLMIVLYARVPRVGIREQLPAVLVSGGLLGIAYSFLLEALDRGRVTVVAPLYATESLWAVFFAAVLLRRAEPIGKRVVVAALLTVAGGVLIGASR